MRFNINTYVIIGVVLLLPQIVFGSTPAPAPTGADVIASDGTKVNFNPSENPLGLNGNTVADDSGSIEALTFLTTGDDPATIGIRIINLALGFLGTISLVLMLYAGFIWFKARDNEEEVKKAKDIIAGSITGLAITMMSYGLAYLIFSFLASNVTGGTVQ